MNIIKVVFKIAVGFFVRIFDAFLNETDDKVLDQYINKNFEDLSRAFCFEEFNNEFRTYATYKFHEVNE